MQQRLAIRVDDRNVVNVLPVPGIRLQQIVQIIPVLNLPEAAAGKYGAIRAVLEATGRTI